MLLILLFTRLLYLHVPESALSYYLLLRYICLKTVSARKNLKQSLTEVDLRYRQTPNQTLAPQGNSVLTRVENL